MLFKSSIRKVDKQRQLINFGNYSLIGHIYLHQVMRILYINMSNIY